MSPPFRSIQRTPTLAALHRSFAGWLAFAGFTYAAPFTPPSAETRLQAIGSLAELPPVARRLLTPDADFAPIRTPGPNDWLSAHPESGQTFEDFRVDGANQPDATRRIIYLQPLGAFPDHASPPLPQLREYAAAFFQMEVRLLAAPPAKDAQFESRRNRHTGKPQLLTSSVRDFLQDRLPADAFCLLGITMEDLYPAPAWNYVFGEASLVDRVGVYSFARYDPAFFGAERTRDYRQRLLQRSCKVLAHETAHMFGLQHCIYFDCLVNGSNHLREADARPQHLCPVCLRKLQRSVGFDLVKRYEALARFYRTQRWREEEAWGDRQLAKAKP